MERLLEIVRQGIDQQLLFIRYEDLCSNPRQELERYYAYQGCRIQVTTSTTWSRSPRKTARSMAAWGPHDSPSGIAPASQAWRSGSSLCDWISNAWLDERF